METKHKSLKQMKAVIDEQGRKDVMPYYNSLAKLSQRRVVDQALKIFNDESLLRDEMYAVAEVLFEDLVLSEPKNESELEVVVVNPKDIMADEAIGNSKSGDSLSQPTWDEIEAKTKKEEEGPDPPDFLAPSPD